MVCWIHDLHWMHFTLQNLLFYIQERGAEKERRPITEVVHKQIEEEKARVPKANPYPYTTDFPVVRFTLNTASACFHWIRFHEENEIVE